MNNVVVGNTHKSKLYVEKNIQKEHQTAVARNGVGILWEKIIKRIKFRCGWYHVAKTFTMCLQNLKNAESIHVYLKNTNPLQKN